MIDYFSQEVARSAPRWKVDHPSNSLEACDATLLFAGDEFEDPEQENASAQ